MNPRVAMPKGWSIKKGHSEGEFILTDPNGMSLSYSNEISLGSGMAAAFLKAILDTKCRHSFHYFGDYPVRRCVRCNALENEDES